MSEGVMLGKNTTIYSCGCKREGNPRWGEDKLVEVSYPCYDCQQKMIGLRTTVVRYGDIPTCGKSYNHRENKYEEGVSVYLQTMLTRPEFTDRKKFVFSAVIIGWGGDDEPLIDPETISNIKDK